MSTRTIAAGASWILTALAFAALTSCSSSPTLRKSDPGAPTILTAHTEPGTIELNRDLQPIRAPKVQADIKDFHSKVTEATLEFANVPVTIPMIHIDGDTWEADLDDRTLEMMAVSGETTKYGAKIVAKNADGKTGLSDTPIEVAVKAPGLAKPSKT